MSQVAVADINELKGVSAETPKLRFVDSKLCWYKSNPASNAVGDDDLVIVPTSGTGRWLKQQSASTSNTILQIDNTKTSNFTASTNTHYLIDLTSASNTNCTVTLPSNPPSGTRVDITYVSSTNILKKVRVARNGSLIQGLASDIEIFTQYSYLYMTYINSTFGWSVVSDRPLTRFQNAVSIVRPGSTNQAQQGIIHYLGTELGTMTYQNPTFHQLSPFRPGRVQVFNYTNSSAGGINLYRDWSSTGTICFNKTVSAASSTTFSATNPNASFLNISFYNVSTYNPIYVRLQDLYIEWAVTDIESNASFAVPGFSLLGLTPSRMGRFTYTDLDLMNSQAGYNTYANYANNINYGWNTELDWDLVLSYNRSTISPSPISNGFYSTGNPLNAEFISVNSPNYYSHFCFKNTRISTTNTFAVHHLEFYGDVLL